MLPTDLFDDEQRGPFGSHAGHEEHEAGHDEGDHLVAGESDGDRKYYSS